MFRVLEIVPNKAAIGKTFKQESMFILNKLRELDTSNIPDIENDLKNKKYGF